MHRTRKSRSKAPAAVKPAPGATAGSVEAYAYALPESATKDFLIRTPPSGVRLAFVAQDPAAEDKLKAWASVRMERTGRIVTSEQGAKTGVDNGIEPSAYDLGPRARAMLRGKAIAEADLEEAGGAFDLEQVRGLLNGISRQALEKRVRDGSLLAVPGPSNRRRYPAAQFTPEGIVPGLREVQKGLPTRNPWAVLNFLVRPDDRLGGRKPIEMLGRGEVDLVVSAARAVGVQGG